jgi:prepilin-type N-terminal cleavage/methylation domain-containing protein
MKRQGFTLTELVAVITAVTVVMGITVMLFAQLFDFQRNNSEYAERSRNVDRFIANFRNDVRAYGKPEILSESSVLLRWKTEAEIIEYVSESGEFPDQQNIIRTVRQEGKQNRYETYQLPDRTALRFVDGKDNDAGLVALSLWVAQRRSEIPNLDELNPFDRTVSESREPRIDPEKADNWRTIIARY